MQCVSRDIKKAILTQKKANWILDPLQLLRRRPSACYKHGLFPIIHLPIDQRHACMSERVSESVTEQRERQGGGERARERESDGEREGM